jgi:phosphatidylglycerophosphate synthase
MATAFIVYLASIADNVHWVLVASSIILGISAMVMWISSVEKEADEIQRNYRKKWTIGLAIAMFSSILLIGMVPSSSDVYKIAGVSGQRKAMIDANGAVLESQQKNGNQ